MNIELLKIQPVRGGTKENHYGSVKFSTIKKIVHQPGSFLNKQAKGKQYEKG